MFDDLLLLFFFFFLGVFEDRIGFFPAAFAHLVRAGDQVFKCNRTFIGCKEQGQITLKEGQVVYVHLVLMIRRRDVLTREHLPSTRKDARS